MGVEDLKRLSKMKAQANEHLDNIQNTLNDNGKTLDIHLEQVQSEYHRVVELSGQAGKIINEIDRDFKEKTKLNHGDTVLLFIAVALQCARQYLFTNDKFRISATQGDTLVEGMLDFTPMPKDWKDILTDSVPYDAFQTGPHVRMTGLSGTTHRYRTLGHDPLLGWIFGTANIMTSSLTKYDLETFLVKDFYLVRHYPLGVVGMFEKAGLYAKEDPCRLAAAIAKQAIHFGSDYFTKQGLPVPLVSSINNDLAATMLKKWHIDMWSITRGASLSALINCCIILLHRLFYDETKDGNTSFYEVRTRKILSYSNIIASSSNVIISAMTKDLTKLDVGGIINTLYRIVVDTEFINEIKKDFLRNTLYDQIVGTEYDFMED